MIFRLKGGKNMFFFKKKNEQRMKAMSVHDLLKVVKWYNRSKTGFSIIGGKEGYHAGGLH